MRKWNIAGWIGTAIVSVIFIWVVISAFNIIMCGALDVPIWSFFHILLGWRVDMYVLYNNKYYLIGNWLEVEWTI